jgi:hypothetical protein
MAAYSLNKLRQGESIMADKDIVVIGGKAVDNVGNPTSSYSYYLDQSINTWHQVELLQNGEVKDTIYSGDPPRYDDPNDASDTVHIDIVDQSHMAEAVKAAANVLKGMDMIKAGYTDEANPNQEIVVVGKHTSAAAELAHAKNTELWVTDKTYTNGGVGQSSYNPNGHNRIELNYESFDGDGANDYAHPNYQNMEGMVGILGHELAHATAEGAMFNQQSNSYWAQYNARTKEGGSFNYSDFWENNEAWANAYSRGMANATGLDIDTWNPAEGFSYKAPNTLYREKLADGGFRSASTLDIAEDPSSSEVTVIEPQEQVDLYAGHMLARGSALEAHPFL